MQLVCPAGTPAALKAAVDAGADAVYCGFRDETNARNFPGLNFNASELAAGIGYAHARGAKVYVAVNTFARAGAAEAWQRAIDTAAELGADAVILADIGLLDYATGAHPTLRLHLSVQAGASHAEAIAFYVRAFGVRRVVLPRVLTVAEIAALNRESGIETEVFAFGGMCPMAEGRCAISSYATGKSPNLFGACSPASHVRYETRAAELVVRVGEFAVDSVPAGALAGYPTICKGRFAALGRTLHLFEAPVSLNAAEMLPELARAGVHAIKIEGRQRGRAYVAAVVRNFRQMLDALERGGDTGQQARELRALAEGGAETEGAYRRGWR
ncbi:MAG TPA: peptidase U32 family protein [Alphaproteobacteria bacterium]